MDNAKGLFGKEVKIHSLAAPNLIYDGIITSQAAIANIVDVRITGVYSEVPGIIVPDAHQVIGMVTQAVYFRFRPVRHHDKIICWPTSDGSDAVDQFIQMIKQAGERGTDEQIY